MAGTFTYNSQYFGLMTGGSPLDDYASRSTLLTSPAAAPVAPSSSMFSISPDNMATVGAVAGIFGGINSAYGAFASARSTKNQLEFQAKMSEINARQAEQQAQSIMYAAERQAGQVTLRAGKVKSSQKASMAANGIALGEGSAAETIATTDLMKEIDALTINANAVRAAAAARSQSVNYSNQSLLSQTSSDTISPFSSAATSMISSATTVASSWYSSSRSAKIAAALGIE